MFLSKQSQTILCLTLANYGLVIGESYSFRWVSTLILVISYFKYALRIIDSVSTEVADFVVSPALTAFVVVAKGLDTVVVATNMFPSVVLSRLPPADELSVPYT